MTSTDRRFRSFPLRPTKQARKESTFDDLPPDTMIPPRLLYVLCLFSMTDCAIRHFFGHWRHPILSGCPMDTLARFRLEAAKTRPCRLCNTTPRISHWIDWHSALATTSGVGCLSLLYWHAPFQRTPLYKTRCLPDPFAGIASRKGITPSHRAISLGRLPVLQRPCASAWLPMTWRRVRTE